MRTELQKLANQRKRFCGTVEKFGWKKAFRGPDLKTIMISNVHLADRRGNPVGEVLTDHVWFTCGKWSYSLEVGDHIAFFARVEKYVKGYKGPRDDVWDAPIEEDYLLKRPTKVVAIKQPTKGKQSEISTIFFGDNA